MGLVLEQLSYIELHKIMARAYTDNPEHFLAKVGCKPEDMTGEMYRSYYKEIIMMDPPIDGSPAFQMHFLGGNAFKDE